MNPQPPRPPPSPIPRAPLPDESLPELLRLHAPRMLVVEDDRELEPLLRRAAGAHAPPIGVEWCVSAEDARVLLDGGYYDLVLVDYVLEGAGSGLSLRAECSALQPQAIFAVTSSHPLPDYLHSVGRPGTPFLPKPFDLWTCRAFLASLLDGSGTR